MKQAIRALSIATKILWTLVIIFSLTAVYSAASLRIGLGEPKTSFSNGIIALSIPMFINNTGFYEIANLNITTHLEDRYGKTVSTSTTIVPTIPPSNNVQKAHSITLNLTNLANEFPYLAFNDTVFGMHTFVALRFADVIPIQMSANGTIPWGAPFYNFSIGKISFDYAQMKVAVPLTFENHAFFSINGTMRLEIYNNKNEKISATNIMIDALPGFRFEGIMEMSVDLSKLTHEGQIYVFFETPVLSVGPIIKSWAI